MPKRKTKKSQKLQKRRPRRSTAGKVTVKDDQNHCALEPRFLVVALLTATFVWSCSPMMSFDIW